MLLVFVSSTAHLHAPSSCSELKDPLRNFCLRRQPAAVYGGVAAAPSRCRRLRWHEFDTQNCGRLTETQNLRRVGTCKFEQFNREDF